MKRTLIIGALLSLLMLSSLVGCGGGSEAASLTKKQFVQRAKAICVAAETEQFNQGAAYMEAHPGIEEEDAVVPAALPPIEKELEKLKKLPAPDESQSQLALFYEALEKALADTKKDPGSALVQKDNPFDEANNLAEQAGLEGCSSNP
ncbi:MAG TPA: hypothetical protein VG448_01805 [Solirubrobacterales bacterium]|nr:hypothetical protein [Solirubrobacterales bacterium]